MGKADPEQAVTAMVKAIDRPFRWREMLENGMHATIGEIAAAGNANESCVGRILRLTLLGPDIVEAIFGGTAACGDDIGPADAAVSSGLAATAKVARQAHNLKVRGSNPLPATK
jgi:hypothetical protein